MYREYIKVQRLGELQDVWSCSEDRRVIKIVRIRTVINKKYCMLVETPQNNIQENGCRKLEWSINRGTHGEYLEVFIWRMRKYYRN